MINWLTLDRDTTISYMGQPVGAKGELFIEQNSTGFHNVLLGENNIGTVNIGKQPEVITRMTWLRTPGKCIWTSEIVTPELIFNQPDQITDLSAYIVDSRGVELRWTAPKGNPPTDRVADRYRIYLSEGEINTANNEYYGLPEYKQLLVPKAPGENESIILTGLKSASKYYVIIVAESTIFGKVKKAVASNIISFTTNDNYKANTATSNIIPFLQENIYQEGISFDISEITGKKLDDKNIGVMDGIISQDGIPTGIPLTEGVSYTQFGVSDPNRYNKKSFDIIIGLDGYYDIDYYYIYLTDNIIVELQTSQDGTTWLLSASFSNTPEDRDKWVNIPANAVNSSGVKYIKIAFKAMTGSFKSLLAYGKRTEQQIISGIKFKRNVPQVPFNKKVGTNAFPLENSTMVSKVAQIQRIYCEPWWLLHSDWHDVMEQGDPLPNLNDVKYVFATCYMWDWDAKFEEFHNKGVSQFLCVNNSFPYLRVRDETPLDPILTKPLDPGLNHRDISVSTNPASYKHIARWAYNWAARYGTNTNVPDTYLQLAPGEVIKKGLGTCTYLEFGNEKDAYYRGEYNHWSPEESAAILSALYDGHKGTMGQGFGVKQADPNYKLTMNSIAQGWNIGWLHKMRLWWDLNRGVGDYPIDIINIHHYNTTSGSQSVAVYGADYSAGLAPEKGDGLHIFRDWQTYRDQYMQNTQIWITEIGYDEHWGGVLSPDYPTQYERSRHKAYWILRTFLTAFGDGIDAITHYWFANTTVRLEDLSANQKYRDIFITCGITDGVNAFNDWNRKPLMSYWYIQSMMKELSDYEFLYYLVRAGQVVCDNYQIATVHPELWAQAYKNKITGDTVIVVWLGSTTLTSYPVKIYVHPSENSVTVRKIEDAEIRKQEDAFVDTLVTQSDSGGKFIEYTISECPVIINTKNISKEKLIAPKDISVQAISTSVVKLAWKDENIGDNDTIIFQAPSAAGTFTPIYTGYIDTGEYNIGDLLEGETYFYKIGFSKNGLLSDVSDTISIQTKITIPAPVNLAVLSVDSDTVNLIWEYNPTHESMIDSFEIYRSSEANGVYTLIDTVTKTLRSYSNNGLTPNTKFFYYIRAKKDFTFSVKSNITEATTQNVDVTTPIINNLKSNYAGDRITLRFNTQMQDPSGQQAGFMVVDTYQDNSVSIPVIETKIDSGDSRNVLLMLGSVIRSSSSVVSVTYESTNAMIQSQTGIRLESVYDKPIVNNKDNSELLTKLIKINFTRAGVLGGAGWNDIIFPYPDSSPTSEQAYTTSLVNSITGQATNIAFVAPRDDNESISWTGVSEETAPLTNDKFPTNVSQYGIIIGNARWGGKTRMMFLNLDPTKEYNLRFLFNTTIYNTTERYVYYKSWNNNVSDLDDFTKKTIPGAPVYVTSLKPVTTPLTVYPPTGGYADVAYLNLPKVGIDATFNEIGMYACGVILEEVIP